MAQQLKSESSPDRGAFSAHEAKAIGDCAIVAMCEVTGLPWEAVWEAAKHSFSRTGLNPASQMRVMRQLGWEMDDYWKVVPPTVAKAMNVRQAEAYLQANDPDRTLICAIHVNGAPHSVAFTGGTFKNVLGCYRSAIRSAYSCRRVEG